MISNPALIIPNALGAKLAADERLILCGFRGDPNEAEPGDWRPRPWCPGRELPFNERYNAYVAVSAFGRAPDGSWRRRTETFAAGLALMVDDVGTKVAHDVVAAAPATARVMTSPGNEQWWYLLSEPERDRERFDGVIRAFIARQLLGADPGMSGINRVGRLPGFTNGKAAYGGDFRTQLVEWRPERLWTVDNLLRAFQLTIARTREFKVSLPNEQREQRTRAYVIVRGWLRENGLLKRERSDVGGWTEVHCPWKDEHTAGADTGAAIREPAAENEYHGAFKCHHGHCDGRGWAELTEWIADQAAVRVAEANRDAPRTLAEA